MAKLVLKTKYYWKELSDDGLLKEPPELGPYYDEVSLNHYGGGYDSEEEAYSDLLSKPKFEGYCLVLVKEVRMLNPGWN